MSQHVVNKMLFSLLLISSIISTSSISAKEQIVPQIKEQTELAEHTGEGQQLIIELYGCNSEKINNMKLIEEILVEAAEAAGAHVVERYFHHYENPGTQLVERVFHQYTPQGVSGVLVLTESHLAIHTWPEHGYAAIDLFTCGNLCDNDKAYDVVKEKFEASSSSLVKVKRGFFQPGETKVLHKDPIFEKKVCE